MNKKILDIPKIKQLKNYCGVASLCMISAYFGKNISQKEMADYFGFEIEGAGVIEEEIQKVARELGFEANIFERLDMNSISYFIQKNSPIIATGKAYNNFGFIKARHAYLIKGYDLEKQILFINDSNDKRKNQFQYEIFKKLWIINGKDPSIRRGLVISR